MPTKHELVKALYVGGHIGPASGISSVQLANLLGCGPRRVRALVTAARRDGIAVCGVPRTGYFVADTPEDVRDRYAEFLMKRAKTSLYLASIATKRPMAELAGQLLLDA